LARSGVPRDVTAVSRSTLLLERILPIGILAVALIGAPIMIFAPEGLPRMRAVEKELSDVEEDNAQLRREIDALRGNVARLRDDPAAIERIARDNLGLVRQTEVVFQFPVKR
jgi:cell division protein FtsB